MTQTQLRELRELIAALEPLAAAYAASLKAERRIYQERLGLNAAIGKLIGTAQHLLNEQLPYDRIRPVILGVVEPNDSRRHLKKLPQRTKVSLALRALKEIEGEMTHRVELTDLESKFGRLAAETEVDN